MTVYKFPPSEKKPEKATDGTDVVATLLKPEVVVPATTNPTMTFSLVSRKKRPLFYLLIGLSIMIFLALLAVGCVFLYYHVHTRSEPVVDISEKPFEYSSRYYENKKEELANTPHGFFNERVIVPHDFFFERIEVPQFDDCDSSIITHDFIYNYTAIVDTLRSRCYVMKLNRTQVVPPQDIIDLVRKIWTGHYMPKVRTLREKYMVLPRQVKDVGIFGKYVEQECYRYKTFKLVKPNAYFKKMWRRMHKHFYGYYAFRQNLIKVEIHS